MSTEKLAATAKANVEFTIKFTLTLGEAKALESIAGYGVDSFLQVFYPKLGKSYLKANEADFRALLERIQASLPKEISKIEAATHAINEALKPFSK